MRLPVEIERKLGMIKANGYNVSVVFNLQTLKYEVTIGREYKQFRTVTDFYSYVDEKLQEVTK